MPAPPAAARALLADLSRLRAEVADDGAATLALWARSLRRPAFTPAAANLAYYLALRRRDVRTLQDRLSQLGLSSLGQSEARVLPALDAILSTLTVLSGNGAASRGEATDAAMGQRAECVMLNKGPHQVEAIAFLDDVLRRMDRHQHKKSARLGPLGSWSEPQTL